MLKKVLAITFICSLAFAGLAQAAKKPNIVFLFSDDHAVQAISAYGSKLNKTPNIDSLAEDGAIFTRNYCANSLCAPSRACILTGLHSHKNGLRDNGDRFDGNQQTFPKILQKNGYTTAIFGKWHLKTDPTGFDKWMVYPGQGSYYNPDYRTPEGKKRIEGYSVELTTDFALDFIKEQKYSGKPFLLMCQFKAPHREWNPGPDYLNKYRNVTFPEPDTLFDDYSGRAAPASKQEMEIDRHMNMPRDLKVPVEKSTDWKRMNDIQRANFAKSYRHSNEKFLQANLKGKDLVRWKYQRFLQDYLACIAAVDDNIGRILAYLKDNDLEDNTIVVYSSDQGFYLGEHGWFDKRWMYEESFRMPLFVRWPGVVKPGTVIDKLTQNIDFAPTFLDMLGLQPDKKMQGESFYPLLKGEPVQWRKSLYYHYYEFPAIHMVAKQEGVTTERYKLINYYETEEWELFDLVKDPQEMNSVYDNSEYASIQKELKTELARLRKLYDAPPLPQK